MTYLAYFQEKFKEKDTAMFIFTSQHAQVDYSNNVYNNINDVTNVPVYSRLKQDYINF